MFFSATPFSHIAEVIFVGDPMCSWCYGFSPELKNHLGYWEAVHKMTGLSFNATALSQEGFNYTTEDTWVSILRSVDHADKELRCLK